MSEPDTNTRLARERTRAAADRTLMAWIRTSISMIGFGFTIAKLGDVAEGASDYKDPIHGMQIFGGAFMVLGVLALVGAMIQHRWILKGVAQGQYTYMDKRPLAMTVAILLIWIGLFGAAAIFLT